MKSSILLIATIFLFFSCRGGSEQSEKTNSDAVREETPVLKAADDLSSHPGAPIYKKQCLVCHQADGNGVPGMFPTLQDTDWVNGDKETLISIVLHGMDEEIEVNGEIYNAIMAPLPHLSDQEVADVLNYVRKRFGSAPQDISVSDVASVRADG